MVRRWSGSLKKWRRRICPSWYDLRAVCRNSNTIEVSFTERIDATDAEDWPDTPEQEVRSDWLTGKVVRVSDGDTLVLMVDEEDGQGCCPSEDR